MHNTVSSAAYHWPSPFSMPTDQVMHRSPMKSLDMATLDTKQHNCNLHVVIIIQKIHNVSNTVHIHQITHVQCKIVTGKESIKLLIQSIVV